jgi:hypothetical protein
LGNILLRLHWVKPHELEKALHLQSIKPLTIGAALISSGFISRERIGVAVSIQEKMRRGELASAELDILDAVMNDSDKQNKHMADAIEKRLRVAAA